MQRDWIVTSGNAEEIIRRVPEDYEILFAPDRHLGQYLEEVTGRKMILWNGSCMVHEIRICNLAGTEADRTGRNATTRLEWMSAIGCRTPELRIP